MLHGSETWPVRKENVVALQRAEMRISGADNGKIMQLMIQAPK